jgi:hypothetical protein
MTTTRNVNPFQLSGERRELARLVGRIQILTLELRGAQQCRLDTTEVDAKKRTLDRLRWQLAAVARRTATRDLDNAA